MSMFEVYDGRVALYQWDLNRKLIVHDEKCKEVHFFNGTTEKAPACEVYNLDGNRVVDVPNLLLQTNRNITVYAYIKAQDGAYTKRAELFQVLSRPKPDDYVYTETEVKSWDALAERVAYLEGEGLADAVANYLEENPIEAGATAEEAEQIQKNKEDIEKLQEDKLDASKLPEAVNDALAQAKESGEFKGDPGYTPVKGVDYFDGEPGYTPVKGKDYFDGEDYILTEADKQEIAEQAAEIVDVPKGGSNQPLTFTGAVSATYDGSSPVSVEIPSGGGGGESEWELIGEINFTEASLGTPYFEWTTEKGYSHLYITADNCLSNQNMGFSVLVNEYPILQNVGYKTDSAKSLFTQVFGDLYGENWLCGFMDTAYTAAVRSSLAYFNLPARTIGKATKVRIRQSAVQDYQAYGGTIKIWGR